MNRKIYLSTTLMLCMGMMPAFGQQQMTRRASIRGGGGGDSGKCTIEVDVDGVAEVEVNGDMGRIRTLSGQPAVWRRFECTSPMPRRVGDFRFRGIDGRGDVNLVSDPRSSGRAVVRIEDRQGGREGYTFDLEWRGGSGGVWPGGYDNGPGRGDGRYDGRGRYDGPNGGGGRFTAAQAIRVCQENVLSRLNRDGYQNINFEQVVPDNNPGRNDWIVGTAIAGRGNRRAERFNFSCSVDFSSGRVRSVDLQRR